MWISYGTLIAVWYCPVVMGKKTHRNGQKNHRNGQKKTTGILCGISYGTLIAVWYCPVVMGKKTQEYAVVFPMDSMWYFLWFRCVVFPQNTTRYFRQGRFLEWNKIYKK